MTLQSQQLLIKLFTQAFKGTMSYTLQYTVHLQYIYVDSYSTNKGLHFEFFEVKGYTFFEHKI